MITFVWSFFLWHPNRNSDSRKGKSITVSLPLHDDNLLLQIGLDGGKTKEEKEDYQQDQLKCRSYQSSKRNLNLEQRQHFVLFSALIKLIIVRAKIRLDSGETQRTILSGPLIVSYIEDSPHGLYPLWTVSGMIILVTIHNSLIFILCLPLTLMCVH